METSFDPICPKTVCSLSPTPVMQHIKFDQDWPTGFRNIQVWKCGRRRKDDDGPLVYYKLILWALGSGELKSLNTIYFTSITQKNRCSRRCGSLNVGIQWSYVMVATGIPSRKPLTLNGRPLPAVSGHRVSNPSCSSDKQGFYLCTIHASNLQSTLLVNKLTSQAERVTPRGRGSRTWTWTRYAAGPLHTHPVNVYWNMESVYL